MTSIDTWILLAGGAAALCAAVAAVRVDLAERRLPNPIVAAAATAGWATALALVFTSDATLTRLVVVVAVTTGPLFLVWLVQPASMGAGDVKLAAALSPLLAWPPTLPATAAIAAAFILAAPQALIAQRSPTPSTLAFGPYITASIAIVVLANLVLA